MGARPERGKERRVEQRGRFPTDHDSVSKRLDLERVRLDMRVEYYRKNPKRYLALYDRAARYERIYQDSDVAVRYPNRQRMKTVLGMLVDVEGMVLDIGSGDGTYGVRLAKKSLTVISLEVSPARVMLTRENFARRNITGGEFIVADARHLPFRSSVFDAILCSEVIEHVPNFERILREVRRTTRIHGTTVFTTPVLDCFETRLLKFIDKYRYRRLVLWLYVIDAKSHLHRFHLNQVLAEVRASGLTPREIICVPTIYFALTFLARHGFPRIGILIDRILGRFFKQAGRFAVIKADKEACQIPPLAPLRWVDLRSYP